MEYIRRAKTQEDYSPHIRHCIYGLDADLIMLALLSHEPHFCLLREENRTPLKRKPTIKLKDQQFHLLQISLFRDYLNWEFSSLQSIKNFKYDIRRIIDDFILLCIFVGNDFLPHLPNLHIDDGAIGVLFKIYKKILPQAGGYLNDSGTLHTHRLQLLLDELVLLEYQHFETSTGNHQKCVGIPGTKFPLNDTQRALVDRVESFVRTYTYSPRKSTATLVLPGCSDRQDRNVLRDLAEKLDLWISFDNDPDTNAPLISLGFFQDDLLSVDPVVDAVHGILRDLQGNGTYQPETPTQIHTLDSCTEEILTKIKRTPLNWGMYGRKPYNESDDDHFHACRKEWKSKYYQVSQSSKETRL
jgi:5'-3' exoribonuclease 1